MKNNDRGKMKIFQKPEKNGRIDKINRIVYTIFCIISEPRGRKNMPL